MRKTLLVVLALLIALLAVVPAFAQERGTLPEQLAADADGRFTTLLAAVEAAGLVDALSGEGPFTVLAPTNEAFDAALAFLGVSAEDLLADTETLTAVLTYHVIPERLFFRNLTSGPTVETLQGDTVTFDLTDGVFTAEGVQILDVDNVASNGVFHVAEGVLLPPAIREAAAANRAHVRVAHLSPDAGDVDVYANGAVVAEAVGFGVVSEWMEVPAGDFEVGVAAPGSEPASTTTGRVEPGSWVTVAAIGSTGIGNLQLAFLVEDYSTLADGTARVSVLHALYGAPAVDVLAGGSPLIVNLAYPGTNGNNDGFDIRTVPAGLVNVQVVPTGATEPVVLSGDLALNAGTNTLVVATGTPDNPQIVVASAEVPAGE